MRLFISTKKGFSLLEMIVVMLLVGIMAALAGVGYVQVVRGMLFTKMNAATIQKGEITITKLVKEFNNINISSIDPGTTNATSITFISVKDIGPSSHTVALSGDMVLFDGDILTDQVSDFSLKYYDNFEQYQRNHLRNHLAIVTPDYRNHPKIKRGGRCDIGIQSTRKTKEFVGL